MELILLCLTAIFIAKYAEKHSSAITIAHAVLFIVLAFLSLFTTNISAVQGIMEHICGADNYWLVREAMRTPCIWLYSANAVIYLAELIMLLIVTVSATVRAAKRLLKSKKVFARASKPVTKTVYAPVCFRAEGNYIFLKYCRILD